MSSLLLTTKFHAPLIRTRSVIRSTLLARLHQAWEKKLILVSAPAGYGKTTLLCEWLAECEQPSAWISLDKEDNDPIRFWSYIVAALQDVFRSLGKTFPEIAVNFGQPSDDVCFTELINALDIEPQALTLVLDDYHHIESQSIHQGVTFLLDHAPSNFHLAIITRADPPLPLARLRARSQMLEIRQSDLCFSTFETTEFLKHTMGLDISAEDTVRLTQRTEGWIAGLQMAALSMQNADDVSGFVATLTGSHHYIFDYLLEEVLERQAPEIRRFLLHTSILDQLTAPLCDAIIEAGDESTSHSSDVILERLEDTNLFIIALDHERRWYRYHALFVELLRNYLGQKDPDQISVLHTRASIWFESQGSIAEAIHHALMAGNWERVVALISTNIFALLEQNELSAVARQLDHIASEKSLARPWLWVGRAWLAAYTGQLRDVDFILKNVEAEISCAMSGKEQQSLRGHCAAIRAFSDWMGGRHILAEQTAREALENLNEADYMLRCLAATILGLASPDMLKRIHAFEQALFYSSQCNVSHITFFAHGCWAYDLVLQGRLSEALDFCKESLRLAKSNNTRLPLPTVGYIHITIAMILWQRNELDAALHHATEGVALALHWEQADSLHFAYTILGDILFAIGAEEEAFTVLQQAWQVAHRTSKWFEEITINQEIEWYLMQGKVESALERLRIAQIKIEDHTDKRQNWFMDLSIAQIFLAQEKYDKALVVLSFVMERLTVMENRYHSVRVLAWQALAYFGLGNKNKALAVLENAFTQAEAEGHVRSFFVAGDAFVSLLHEACLAEIHPDYIDELLTHLYRVDKVRVPEAGIMSSLIEPLSRREIDVLKLLSQGYADKQIAESLVIARETVHKHLKNIYGKLGVHNRTEAVIRAKELGLM